MTKRTEQKLVRDLRPGDRIVGLVPGKHPGFNVPMHVLAVLAPGKLSIREHRKRTAHEIRMPIDEPVTVAKRRDARPESIPVRRFYLKRVRDGATFFVRQCTEADTTGERRYRIEHGPGQWGQPFRESEIERILTEGRYVREDCPEESDRAPEPAPNVVIEDGDEAPD